MFYYVLTIDWWCSESNWSSTSAVLVDMTMHTTYTHIYFFHNLPFLLILGKPFNPLRNVIINKITTKSESRFVHLFMVKCTFYCNMTHQKPIPECRFHPCLQSCYVVCLSNDVLVIYACWVECFLQVVNLRNCVEFAKALYAEVNTTGCTL